MLLALGFAVIACDKGAQGPAAETAAGKLPPACSAPTRSDRPASWDGDPIRITALTSSGTSLTLRVLLPEGSDAPDGTEPSGFNLTLPLGGQVSITAAAFTVGGKPVTGSIPDFNQYIKLRQAGLMRNWPIWHLDLLRPFWDSIRRHAVGRSGAIEVTFLISAQPAQAMARPRTAVPPNHPMRILAERLVANPGDLGRWETMPKPSVTATDPRPLARDGKVWLKTDVESDGLYRIEPERLQAEGLIESPAQLERVRMFTLGKPVATMAVSQSEPGRPAGIYFYGRYEKSPYGTRQAYWITASDAAPAARWATVDSTATVKNLDRLNLTARLDRDLVRKLAQNELLSITGIDWVDSALSAAKPLELPVAFHSPIAGENTPLTARLRFLMKGEPGDWKGTAVALGFEGRELARHEFNESLKVTWSPRLPADILREGTATLTLSVINATTATRPRGESQIWFDNLEIDYPARPSLIDGRFVFVSAGASTPTLARVDGKTFGPAPLAFEIDGAVKQIRERDGGFTISNRSARAEIYDPARVPALAVNPVAWADDALNASAPVDYLIIAHPSLEAALEPLLQLNRDRGLSTKVVDIDALYDLFGDGVLNPEVIRRYLAHAMNNWPGGAPSYVLLFGDCTSDFLSLLRNKVPNLVPTYSYKFDESWASDAWFTMFSGNDELCDTMLGRISVNNLNDARSVVDKTVRYARTRPLGPWRARLSYVADETERTQPFREAAEQLRSEMTPPQFDAHCIFLDDIPLEDNWYAPSDFVRSVYEREKKMMKVSTAATDALRDTFGQGTAFLDFFGHGSPNIWCDERIWFGGDSPNRDTLHLAPAKGRYAFITNYTCNTGAIDYPDPPWNISISEDLMRAPDAGAIGMFLPSGPGDTPSHMMLARQWRRGMFGDNLRGFGEMATMARLRFAAGDGPRQMLYMYILLGDPALRLQLAERWQPLDLGEKAVNPDLTDVRHVARLSNVIPESGQALIRVEDLRGKTIWEAQPVSYADGKLELPYQIPASLVTPAPLRVVVYGWNEAECQDFAAGALLDAKRPWVRIASVATARGADLPKTSVLLNVVVRNPEQAPSGNLVLTAARDGKEIGNKQFRIGGNGQAEVQFVVELARPSERIELALTPSRPPDASSAPAVERRAYKFSSDSLTTDTTKLADARVRIVAASIKHTPDPVTEGRTVFVNFEVENAGQGVSAPMRTELLDAPPEKGGQPLFVQPFMPEPEIPALGAGRTWPVTLRWDPVYNAGVKKVWIHLKPVSGPAPANAIEQLAAHSIFARTKWDLFLARKVNASASDEDRAVGRYRFHAFVGNRGETDARGVEVSFFTGPEKRDDQLMGKVIIPRVPAAAGGKSGEAEAVLLWTFDKTKYPRLNTKNLLVTVEMRLLGSSQRTSG
ncbi:C25 family cysteine peptidase [bacterium]|nr:C25 family cysteine peptidase [bacterium]